MRPLVCNVWSLGVLVIIAILAVEPIVAAADPSQPSPPTVTNQSRHPLYDQPVYAVGRPVVGAVVPAAYLALVIGNDGYGGKAELTGAGADANRVASALRSRGYTLIGGAAQPNANIATMRLLFGQLAHAVAAQPGAIAVVYFAGHGHAEGGHTFIDPIAGERESADSDASTGISLASIVAQLRAAGAGLSVIFLDNCRTADQPSKVAYFPEELPDNTFVGFSTALGSPASDETSEYATSLAGQIERGFDTLATLHLTVMAEVNTKTLQHPVFDVSANMPARPLLFYPPNAVPTVMLEADQSLARRCDVLTRQRSGLEAPQLTGPTPAFVAACEEAWQAGVRSKEVMRGVGMAGIYLQRDFQHHADWKIFADTTGLIWQAAELGDGPAAIYYYQLAALATDKPDEALERSLSADLEEPSLPPDKRQETTAMLEALRRFNRFLLQQAEDSSSLSLDELDKLREYGIRRILAGTDKFAATFLATQFGGSLYAKITGIRLEPDVRARFLSTARKRLIRLAGEGYVPAVAYVVANNVINASWTQGLRLREDMQRAVASNYVDDEVIPDNPEMAKFENMVLEQVYKGMNAYFADIYQNKNLEKVEPPAYFTLPSGGYVRQMLFFDYVTGHYGPRLGRTGVAFGLDLEARSPTLALFAGMARARACAILAWALLTGKTVTGEPFATDKPRGLRLAEYAAAQGVPQAIYLLRRYGRAMIP